MTEIKIFLFVLSILYTTKYLITFIIKLFQDDPETIVISKENIVLLHFSTAYIITYFLI
jgi:hypothetical protein